MAFRKIKETINAFKSHKNTEPTVNQRIDQYGQDLHVRAKHIISKKAETANIAVGAIAIFSTILITIITTKIFSNIFEIEKGISNYIGFSVGFIFAYFVGNFHTRLTNWITNRIPFYKLNPYFGSKIRDTMEAFKKHS